MSCNKLSLTFYKKQNFSVLKMNDYDEHNQIEDIIDARKKSGQYDMLLNCIKPAQQGQNINTRYTCSAPMHLLEEARDDLAVYNIEGDANTRFSDVNTVGPTDSEITLIRVKREGSHYRTQVNNWDMHDKAIPGDGSHLGESPSLVNLVTLVTPSKQCLKTSKDNPQEYLVPLSSWEPVEPVLCENPDEYEDCDLYKKNETLDSLLKQKSNSSLRSLFKCFIFWKHNNSNEGCEDATSNLKK